MIVKKHLHEGRMVLAICDEDIHNKTFEEGDLILDLTSSFYKGEKKAFESLKELIKQSYIVNAVGENIIRQLIDENLIDEKNLKYVDGIPHVQILFESS